MSGYEMMMPTRAILWLQAARYGHTLSVTKEAASSSQTNGLVSY